MFLVRGSILTRGVNAPDHAIEASSAAVAGIPNVGSALGWLTRRLLETVAGPLAGALALAAVQRVGQIKKSCASAAVKAASGCCRAVNSLRRWRLPAATIA